jgi:hypothetical protein
MAFIKINAFILLAFLSAVCSLNAQGIENGSFEQDSATIPPLYWQPRDPDCDGCVNNNVLAQPCTNNCGGSIGQPAEIVQTYTHETHQPPVTITAVDGQYFVMLRTGRYSQLTQPIDVNEGQTIVGSYFFATTDWVPDWDDTALIYLSSIDPNITTGLFDIEILLAKKSVSDVDSFGAMRGWGRFSHTFDANGHYMLVLRVEDAKDEAFSSYLAVDALQIIDQPPDPICIYNLVGDINHDCKVDFADFAMMAEHWMIDCNVTPGDSACGPL